MVLRSRLAVQRGLGGISAPLGSPRHNLPLLPAWAPTHHTAQAEGEPGRCAWGQHGKASREAGVGGPQQPEGGIDHTLAGEGGGEEAQKSRPRAAREQRGALQGSPPRPSLASCSGSQTQVSGATSNRGAAGDRRPLTPPARPSSTAPPARSATPAIAQRASGPDHRGGRHEWDTPNSLCSDHWPTLPLVPTCLWITNGPTWKGGWHHGEVHRHGPRATGKGFGWSLTQRPSCVSQKR